jgi:hypothetical protein
MTEQAANPIFNPYLPRIASLKRKRQQLPLHPIFNQISNSTYKTETETDRRCHPIFNQNYLSTLHKQKTDNGENKKTIRQQTTATYLKQ